MNTTLEARGSSRQCSVSWIAATLFDLIGFLGHYVTNKLDCIGSQFTVPPRGEEHLSIHLKVKRGPCQIVPVPFYFFAM